MNNWFRRCDAESDADFVKVTTRVRCTIILTSHYMEDVKEFASVWLLLITEKIV